MTSDPTPTGTQNRDAVNEPSIDLAEAEGWWDYWTTAGTSSDLERRAALVLRAEYDRRGTGLDSVRDLHHQAILQRGYVPNGAVIPLRILAAWLARLDEPHMQGARQVANLGDVIARAKVAVAESDRVRRRSTTPSEPADPSPEVVDRLAAAQPGAWFPITAGCWCGPQPDARAVPHERGGPDCRGAGTARD